MLNGMRFDLDPMVRLVGSSGTKLAEQALISARKTVMLGGTIAALVFLPGLVLTSIFDITTRRIFQFSSTPLQELT